MRYFALTMVIIEEKLESSSVWKLEFWNTEVEKGHIELRIPLDTVYKVIL